MILLLVLVTIVGISHADELRKNGDCKLQVCDSPLDDKVFVVKVTNKKIDVTCNLFGGDSFGKFAVFAIPRVTNKSEKAMSVSYHVVFLDKNGDLIGSISQYSELKGGKEETQLSSCYSKIPEESFRRISSYKMIIYLSE